MRIRRSSVNPVYVTPSLKDWNRLEAMNQVFWRSSHLPHHTEAIRSVSFDVGVPDLENRIIRNKKKQTM